MDHNFISAYFVISEDAKHGENLVCSYYACRNGGIKFRYCAYCMAPVAKRNFSRRHDHGMSKNKTASSVQEEEDEGEDDDTLDESENTGSTDKGSMSNVAVAPSVSKKPKEAAVEVESKRQRPEAQAVVTVAKSTSNGAKEDVSSKRRSMWNDLLNKRPRAKDPKDLSSWLNEVLAVSDLEFPLEKVGNDINHPFGKVLLNELPTLSKPAATPTEDETGDSSAVVDSNSNSRTESPDSAAKDSNSSNTNAADTVVGNEKASAAKEKDTKEPETPVTNNNSETGNSKGVKLLGQKSKNSLKRSIEETTQKEQKKDDEEEGFAGSFADWRDRKKGKLLKKGSGSLRK